MRQAYALPEAATEAQTRSSAAGYVTGLIHDGERLIHYGASVHDSPDAPGRRFAALIKDARALRGMTQEALETASDVSRQTIIRYESGRAVSPNAEELRSVLRALRVDPREAVIALGYVTREEMGLPAAPTPLDPEVAELQKLLSNEMIPDRARAGLLRMLKATRIAWLDVMRTRPAKEPEPPAKPERSRRPSRRDVA